MIKLGTLELKTRIVSKYLVSKIIIIKNANNEIQEIETNEKGEAEIDLVEGDYSVTVEKPEEVSTPELPAKISIEPGETTELDINFSAQDDLVR